MSFGGYYGRNFDCQDKKTTTDDGKGLKYLSSSLQLMITVKMLFLLTIFNQDHGTISTWDIPLHITNQTAYFVFLVSHIHVYNRTPLSWGWG